MKGKGAKVMLGILGVASATHAVIGKSRGLYGKIELGFSRENWKYSDSYNINIKRDIFTQIYQVGFDGYLFKPRILSFDVRTDLRLDLSKYRSGGTTTTNRFRGLGYSLRLNFLRASRIPINVFASRNYMVSRVISKNFEQELDTELNSLGLNLTYLFRKNWFFTFSFMRNTVESIVDGFDYKDENTTYTFNTSYSKANKRISFSVSQTDIDSRSEYYSYNETNRRADLNAFFTNTNWNLNIRSNYYSSKLGDFSLFTQSVNFGYSRDRKLNLNLSGNLAFYRGSTDTTYLSLSENLSYRLSNSWSVSQSASFLSLEDTRSLSLGGGIGYFRNFSETLSANFSLSLSLSRWFGDQDKTYYSYNLGGGIRKIFTSLRTFLSVNGNVSQLFLDGELSTTTVNVYESVNTRITSRVSFNHTASYTHNVSEEHDYSYRIIRTTNSLSWKLRLFRKVFVNAQTGVDFWKSLDTQAESIRPYISMNGRYFASRNLNVRFDVNIYRDSYYNNDLTISANMRTTYKFRKILVTWDVQYNKEVFSNGENYQRSRFYTGIRITRKF